MLHPAAVTATEWNMFQLSGTTALMGRTLQASDQLHGAEAVSVLAYDFWQSAFDGDSTIIGQNIDIGGRPVRIVGVMPERYSFPRWTDMWIPVENHLLAPVINEMELISAYGRLRDDVSYDGASEEMASLMFRMRQQNPPDSTSNYTAILQQVNEVDSGFVRSLPGADLGNLGNQLAFGMLNAMSVMVFLLACINTGTLLLARTNERMKDLSVRVALGAPRKRLLLQVMGESIFIAVIGAALAVLVAGVWLESANLFLATVLDGGDIQFWIHFKIEPLTLLAAVFFAFLTILTTTTLPAWKLINGDFNSVIRDGTRGAAGLHAGRFSKSLVTLAIALITIVLYIGSVGVYSFVQLGRSYDLIDETGKYSIEISTMDQFRNDEERLQFFQSVQEVLRTHPDVQDVTMLGVVGNQVPIGLEGAIYARDVDRPVSAVQVLSGDLTAVGSTLMEGRYLSDNDVQSNSRIVLVSQSLANTLWPGQSPVGQSIRIDSPNGGGSASLFQVVGMVSDTSVDGTEMFTQDTDMIYIPMGQFNSSQITAIITTEVGPASAVQILRNAVLNLNSDVEIEIVDWVREQQNIAYIIKSVIVVSSISGLFALVVSIAGIFGLTKNSVLLRTQEIGTRRALGATDAMIRKSFSAQGARQLFRGFLWAVIVTTPFTVAIFFAAGGPFLISGLSVTLTAMTVLFLCTNLAIRLPIQSMLRSEPSTLLRHQ